MEPVNQPVKKAPALYKRKIRRHQAQTHTVPCFHGIIGGCIAVSRHLAVCQLI